MYKNLEIAEDRTNNCMVLFDCKNRKIFLSHTDNNELLITKNKIGDIYKLFNSKKKEDLNKICRLIRKKLGSPDLGASLYPTQIPNSNHYRPQIEPSDFMFDKVQAATKRNEPNIIVRVVAAGICQSDRRVMLGTKPSNFAAEKIVLGHEGGGYIVDPGVCEDRFTIGQKVVLLPHLTCWQDNCIYCSTGRQNLCANMQHMGFHIQGNMTKFMAYPEQCVMVVPNELDDNFLPLVEPLACVSRGIFFLNTHLRQSNLANDMQKMVIYGGGPIGCLAAICCRIFFKNIHIEIVDPVEKRLETIKQLGFADSYALTSHGTHDVAFIANSYFNSIEMAINNAAPNGAVLLFSGINTDYFLDQDDDMVQYVKFFEEIHRKELKTELVKDNNKINLIGSSGYNYYDISRAIQLLLEHPDLFTKVQNAIIDGLEAKKVSYLYPSIHEVEFENNALLAFLSPEGVFDNKFGKSIASSIKTLIKIN